MKSDGIRLGIAICGSFCTFRSVFSVIEELCADGYDITPIMSEISYITDTRFGSAREHIDTLKSLTGKEHIIHTIKDAEPVGPKSLFDIMVIAPCTGNTLAKLALGVTDTSVTMAAKAHLRNRRPLLIAISSNDALSANAKNLGILLNTRNIFFVPFGQDSPDNKQTSLISDMSLLPSALEAALEGRQLQPLMFGTH